MRLSTRGSIPDPPSRKLTVGGLMVMWPFRALATTPEGPDTEYLRHLVGRLEDQAAVSGWRWDAELSLRVDALLVQFEAQRP